MIEHLLFRGSQNYTAEEFNDYLLKFNGDSNAWTESFSTTYHYELLQEGLLEFLDMISDIL